VYLIIKRVIDFILALLGLIILSPLLLITAIVIKIESKGPAIFKQDRLGQNGTTFKIYKFRSMVVGAEKGGVYSTETDARVTKVGKFIRATSIDELPQFVNILKGDMSIVGPRPTLTYHPWPLEEYTPEQRRRFSVRPGVSGWAQINGRKEVQWDKRIEYDVWYVNNLSFGLDLKIFIKTVIKVLTMQGNMNVGETVSTRVIPGTIETEVTAPIKESRSILGDVKCH
jgi:Sugar transferases involved in lipopolysaccharide synthesis